jgi:hypothetical protein
LSLDPDISLMLVAATDRFFADGGHSLDFVNKAFECVDVIGWEHSAAALPSVVGQMVAARGGEEANAWRHPIDLVPLCEAAFAELPGRLASGANRRDEWRAHAALSEALLDERPEAIVAALQAAVAEGAAPTDLSRSLAYAAALRLARFGTANEFSDWEAAHHVFTYCNALHQLLKRITAARPERPTNPDIVRGVFHGAMRLYLIRFLNVPPARIPGDRDGSLADLPVDAYDLLSAFLAALDRQGEVTSRGASVSGMGRQRAGLPYPDCRIPLPRRTFSDGARPVADGCRRQAPQPRGEHARGRCSGWIGGLKMAVGEPRPSRRCRSHEREPLVAGLRCCNEAWLQVNWRGVDRTGRACAGGFIGGLAMSDRLPMKIDTTSNGEFRPSSRAPLGPTLGRRPGHSVRAWR